MKRNRFLPRPALALLACAVLCGTLTHATKSLYMIQEPKQTAYEISEISSSVPEILQSCMSFLEYIYEDQSNVNNAESPLATLCVSILFGGLEASEEYDPNIIMDNEKRDILKQKFLHFGRKRRDVKASNDLKRQAGHIRTLHFGKRAVSLNTDERNALQQLNDLIKRFRQNRMVHFEKRSPSNAVQFGKRATNRFLHFGKRDPDPPEFDKRSNKFMHFGKRDYEETSAVVNYDRSFEDELIKRFSPSSRFIHLSKRAGQGSVIGLDDVDDFDQYGTEMFRRSPTSANRYLHFGKKASNKFMHFGKRAADFALLEENNNEQHTAPRPDVKKRKRRSLSQALENEGSKEMHPVSQKIFSITYASLPFQQALLRHRVNILDKNQAVSSSQAYSDEDPNQSPSFVGSQVFLDRISRSDQIQMPQLRSQSRWTRPDRNVFLHFG